MGLGTSPAKRHAPAGPGASGCPGAGGCPGAQRPPAKICGTRPSAAVLDSLSAPAAAEDTRSRGQRYHDARAGGHALIGKMHRDLRHMGEAAARTGMFQPGQLRTASSMRGRRRCYLVTPRLRRRVDVAADDVISGSGIAASQGASARPWTDRDRGLP
jgi:hypothetical protein